MVLLQGESPTNTFYLDDIRLEATPPPPPAPKVIVNESQVPPITMPPISEQHQPTPPIAGGKDGTSLWIAAALASILGLLAWLILVIKRGAFGVRDFPPAQSVALVRQSTIPPGATESASPEDWRQRALAAEAVANRQAQILRDDLVPEMAKVAKNTLVRGLASQRNGLLETQRLAEQELMELEERLAALHLPLRERIVVYENRIAELEKEVVTHGEEMRELIRATLSLVRQRLKEEKQKEGPVLK
jgi:hypothetical protein